MYVFRKSIKQTVLFNEFFHQADWLQSPLSPLDVTGLTWDLSAQGGVHLGAGRQFGVVSHIVALRVQRGQISSSLNQDFHDGHGIGLAGQHQRRPAPQKHTNANLRLPKCDL